MGAWVSGKGLWALGSCSQGSGPLGEDLGVGSRGLVLGFGFQGLGLSVGGLALGVSRQGSGRVGLEVWVSGFGIQVFNVRASSY